MTLAKPQCVAITELASAGVSRSGNVRRDSGATALDERIVALHAAGRIDRALGVLASKALLVER